MKPLLILIVLPFLSCTPKGVYKITYGDAQGMAHPAYFDTMKECQEVRDETIRRRIHGYQTLSTCTRTK